MGNSFEEWFETVPLPQKKDFIKKILIHNGVTSVKERIFEHCMEQLSNGPIVILEKLSEKDLRKYDQRKKEKRSSHKENRSFYEDGARISNSIDLEVISIDGSISSKDTVILSDSAIGTDHHSLPEFQSNNEMVVEHFYEKPVNKTNIVQNWLESTTKSLKRKISETSSTGNKENLAYTKKKKHLRDDVETSKRYAEAKHSGTTKIIKEDKRRSDGAITYDNGKKCKRTDVWSNYFQKHSKLETEFTASKSESNNSKTTSISSNTTLINHKEKSRQRDHKSTIKEDNKTKKSQKVKIDDNKDTKKLIENISDLLVFKPKIYSTKNTKLASNNNENIAVSKKIGCTDFFDLIEDPDEENKINSEQKDITNEENVCKSNVRQILNSSAETIINISDISDTNSDNINILENNIVFQNNEYGKCDNFPIITKVESLNTESVILLNQSPCKENPVSANDTQNSDLEIQRKEHVDNGGTCNEIMNHPLFNIVIEKTEATGAFSLKITESNTQNTSPQAKILHIVSPKKLPIDGSIQQVQKPNQETSSSINRIVSPNNSEITHSSASGEIILPGSISIILEQVQKPDQEIPSSVSRISTNNSQEVIVPGSISGLQQVHKPVQKASSTVIRMASTNNSKMAHGTSSQRMILPKLASGVLLQQKSAQEVSSTMSGIAHSSGSKDNLSKTSTQNAVNYSPITVTSVSSKSPLSSSPSTSAVNSDIIHSEANAIFENAVNSSIKAGSSLSAENHQLNNGVPKAKDMEISPMRISKQVRESDLPKLSPIIYKNSVVRSPISAVTSQKNKNVREKKNSNSNTNFPKISPNNRRPNSSTSNNIAGANTKSIINSSSYNNLDPLLINDINALNISPVNNEPILRRKDFPDLVPQSEIENAVAKKLPAIRIRSLETLNSINIAPEINPLQVGNRQATSPATQIEKMDDPDAMLYKDTTFMCFAIDVYNDIAVSISNYKNMTLLKTATGIDKLRYSINMLDNMGLKNIRRQRMFNALEYLSKKYGIPSCNIQESKTFQSKVLEVVENLAKETNLSGKLRILTLNLCNELYNNKKQISGERTDNSSHTIPAHVSPIEYPRGINEVESNRQNSTFNETVCANNSNNQTRHANSFPTQQTVLENLLNSGHNNTSANSRDQSQNPNVSSRTNIRTTPNITNYSQQISSSGIPNIYQNTNLNSLYHLQNSICRRFGNPNTQEILNNTPITSNQIPVSTTTGGILSQNCQRQGNSNMYVTPDFSCRNKNIFLPRSYPIMPTLRHISSGSTLPQACNKSHTVSWSSNGMCAPHIPCVRGPSNNISQHTNLSINYQFDNYPQFSNISNQQMNFSNSSMMSGSMVCDRNCRVNQRPGYSQNQNNVSPNFNNIRNHGMTEANFNSAANERGCFQNNTQNSIINNIVAESGNIANGAGASQLRNALELRKENLEMNNRTKSSEINSNRVAAITSPPISYYNYIVPELQGICEVIINDCDSQNSELCSNRKTSSNQTVSPQPVTNQEKDSGDISPGQNLTSVITSLDNEVQPQNDKAAEVQDTNKDSSNVSAKSTNPDLIASMSLKELLEKDCVYEENFQTSLDEEVEDDMDLPTYKDRIIKCTLCDAVANLQCTKCKIACYCTIDCQKRHWDLGHKNVCFELSAAARLK